MKLMKLALVGQLPKVAPESLHICRDAKVRAPMITHLPFFSGSASTGVIWTLRAPKNLLRQKIAFYLTRLFFTLKIKNNLARLFFEVIC